MTNRVALITGVSSGIGRATALAFIQQGTSVAGVARRTDRLTELEAA
ncbi:MAG: SDR family NAD(P)-dependent oxidoreductase, partial [Anaerolineae bacterium]|nr:SDR family NAD(P)-dependent oxidoreductase [Anaerolineae bacterium]